MNRICNNNHCTACNACVNACPKACITMREDETDTPYPIIDKTKCIDCKLCMRVCPNNRVLDFYSPKKVYAAWSNNFTTRKKSASGGIAVELYNYFIENGGFTVGVELNHHKATFAEIATIDDLAKVQNSKYVFSNTEDIYKRIKNKLEEGINVLFIGLSCQVSGLLCFLKKKYENLTVIDIICHGVVPQEYLRQHIEHVEKEKGKIAHSINFRDPEFDTHTYTFTLRDKEQYVFYSKQGCENDLYQIGFHKGLILRECCYNCIYAQNNRIGDLSIGDFDFVGRIKPVNYEKKHLNCILVNTAKGQNLLNSIRDRIYLQERPSAEALALNPQLNSPCERHPRRTFFLNKYIETHDFICSASVALKEELLQYRREHPGKAIGYIRKAKRELANISNSSRYRIARFLHRPHVAIGGILMLHRIDEPDSNGIWYNQHLKISPQKLEEMVNYARKHKCKFVSLEEMVEAIQTKRNVRRWIAVTLDDGYQDNYTNGSLVFSKLNVPYIIYVCTKMVKGEMLYWWELLEQFVLEHDDVTLSDGRTFCCHTKEAKEQSFLDIREIILKLPQENLLGQLKELFVNYNLDYNYGQNTLGLTWEQLCHLDKDSLATIGNHTYSHLSFTGCKDTEIYDDIDKAAKEMYANTGIEMVHFAFPFGEATAVSRHDIELVKQLGFKTSATTKDGLVCYGTDPLELPRIFVTERNWKRVIDRIVKYC